MRHLVEMPESLPDEAIAKGIKRMLLSSEFTLEELALLPASVYMAMASSVRAAESSGELHGATGQKIIMQSMIEAILDAEYPDEREPL